MKGYKAFSPGLVCRGKQYAENTTFEEDVTPKACAQGMHFCKEPLAVLDYYPLLDDDCNLPDFAEVESLGETHTDDHKKFATNKLHIGAKLSLRDLISAEVSFVKESTSGGDDAQQVGGDYAKQVGGYGAQQVGGDYAKQVGGDYAKQVGGDNAKQVGGRNSIIVAGPGSRWKAGMNTIIVSYAFKCGRQLPPVVGYVDGITLHPDTWYTLENGEFKEVT